MSLFAALVTPAYHPPIRPVITKTIAALPSMTRVTNSPYIERQEDQCRRRRTHNNHTKGAPTRSRRDARSLEDIFISSLVVAGSCQCHRAVSIPSRTTRPGPYTAASPLFYARRSLQTRSFSSRSPKEQEAVAVVPNPEIPRREYENLVNTYPSFHLGELHADFGTGLKQHPLEQKEHYPLAPRLVLAPEKELDTLRNQWRPLAPVNEEHARDIQQLRRILSRQLGRVPLHKVWDAYQRLLSPRPRYLSLAIIQRLFRHLGWVHFRTFESMERYFSLLNECVGEQVPLTEPIWNTAIVFAGRWLRNATSKEVKAAIETWMRMEQSGHHADNVTFNILFQIAVRAGRFALADTIFNELKAREMPLDRYFRSSLIYYAGARRDGEGVRQAFRELVNAGEIVDTGVMNAVILSFFRAGEAAAAEHTFYRMKELHEQKFGTTAPSEWQSKREVTSVLNKTGKALRKEKQQHEASFFGAPFSTDEKREQIQRASPIAPDELTYRIIIKYHTYTSGDIDRIRELLGEMQERGLHVHGSVYVHLLRGFHTHGGYAFSKWNRSSLEDLWSETLTASDPPIPNNVSESDSGDDMSDMLGAMMSEASSKSPNADNAGLDAEEQIISELDRPTYFTKSLALSAVHAFYKCSGKKRMLEVWGEILLRWKNASDEDKSVVQDTVQRLAAEDSIYID